MSKQEFLEQLKNKLNGLPESEINEHLSFYSEMIDDRIEEGFTEEEAVLQIGSIDEIVSQILSDIPLSDLIKEKVKPKRALRVWEIVLLVLGSPLWLSLLLAAFSVFFALYIVLWSVIVSLWAVDLALGFSSLVCFAATFIFILGGSPIAGIAMLGASIVIAGVSIFFFFGCKLATKGCAFLTVKIAQGIKRLFIKG